MFRKQHAQIVPAAETPPKMQLAIATISPVERWLELGFDEGAGEEVVAVRLVVEVE